MGKIFDAFGALTFRNEAEVSQNFILPLLEMFLGYSSNEIIPEKNFPVRNVFSGTAVFIEASKHVNHRPDYVVCINGNTDKVNFIVESKAPTEDISQHIGQLRSYSVSVGQNFSMLTNGTAIQVYNANDLIFFATDISDFQIKFEHFYKLLSRTQQIRKNSIELLQELDYQTAITISHINATQLELSRKQVLMADFLPYLRTLEKQFKDWHLPSADFKGLANLDVKKLDPQELLSFTVYEPYEKDFRKSTYKLPAIQSKFNARLKVFIGATGIGKTTFLKFMAHKTARECLNYIYTTIPVYIPLKRISSVNTLEKVILDILSYNGYHCRDLAILLQNNQFLFLLDAYDEIPEDCLGDADLLIELLSENNFCYLTTRANRIPAFSQANVFEAEPLSGDQIMQIGKLYLPGNHYHFSDQITVNGFDAEAGNTLILLFLLSLYKESAQLPHTVPKVIAAIVKQVQSWNQQKKARRNIAITWEILEKILADIAGHIIGHQLAALDIASCETITLKAIELFEQKRKIPAGTTIDQVINVLKGSGLLVVTDTEAYFWHRLFLNYFGAVFLVTQTGQPNGVHSIEHIPDDIIVGAAGMLPDSSPLIKMVGDNHWLAANCIAENANCQPLMKAAILKQLFLACDSPIHQIRERALFYLERIKDSQVDQFFMDCFSRPVATNVKMTALVAVARTGTPEARRIIERHLDWNQWLGIFGPTTQVAVNKALAYFDETAHLSIINSLAAHGDLFNCEACAEIFIRLWQQGKLTTTLILALEKLYIREYQADHKRDQIMDAISKIFISIDHQPFVVPVVDLLLQNYVYAKSRSILRFLKGVVNEHSAKLLIVAIQQSGDKQCRDTLAEALAEAGHFIDLETIRKLIDHAEKEIRMQGIEALGRFDYYLISDILEPFLDSADAQIQSRAFHVLVVTGEIINFIRSRDLPALHAPAIHTICEGMRKYNLSEAGYLLDDVITQLHDDLGYLHEYHLAFDLARTYHAIGQSARTETIIGWYCQDGQFLQQDEYLHQNMLREAAFFPRKLAIALCACYFHTYFNDDAKRFAMIPFVETAELLQGNELKPLLILLMERTLAGIKRDNDEDKYDMERQMRAFILVCAPEDEDWLLCHIEVLRYDEPGLDSPNLRRALECLEKIGTAKSLPEILSIARDFRHADSVLSLCFSAYERIQGRNGQTLVSAQQQFVSKIAHSA